MGLNFYIKERFVLPGELIMLVLLPLEDSFSWVIDIYVKEITAVKNGRKNLKTLSPIWEALSTPPRI